MKITRRQIEQISGIMQDESNERLKLHNEMYTNKKKSMLNENLMFEAENPDNFEEEISRTVSDETHDMAMQFLTNVDKLMYKKMVDSLRQYGVERMSPTTLRDDVEDFDQDGLMDAQMTLVSDIDQAVDAYVKQVALLVHHIKLAYSDEEM